MPDAEITFKFDSTKVFDMIYQVGDSGEGLGQKLVDVLLGGADLRNSFGLSFYGIEVSDQSETVETGEAPDTISRAEYDQIVKDRDSLMAKLEHELFNHDLCKIELGKVRHDLERYVEIANQEATRSDEETSNVACLKTRLAISEAEATNCRIERDHYKDAADKWQKKYTALKETVNKDWLRANPKPYNTPQDDGINSPPPTGGSGVIDPITELLQEARDIVSSMPGLNALQSQAYRDGNWDAGGTIDLALSAIKRGFELSRKK